MRKNVYLVLQKSRNSGKISNAVYYKQDMCKEV